MVYSKITYIRKSVLRTIKYITDPAKTEGGLYVSSYNCGVHTADLEFALTAEAGTEIGCIKALHLIQSFAAGSIDPITAHEIGRQLVLEYTNFSHEFVLATHVDKDHIHNHAVFNNVSFTDHTKFRHEYDMVDRLWEISDRICARYGLNVGSDREFFGRSHKNPYAPNPSHRKILKDTIDKLLPEVSDLDELLSKLKDEGYEIKGNYPSYSYKRDTDSLYTKQEKLGRDYSCDALISRMGSALSDTSHAKGILYDLNEKLKQLKDNLNVSPSAVKRLTDAYVYLNEHSITSYEHLEAVRDDLTSSVKEMHKKIHEIEIKIDRLKSICEHLKRKEMLNDIYASYLRSGKDQAFKKAHQKEIKLFEASCVFLSDMKVDPSVRYADSLDKLNRLINVKDSYLESYHRDLSELKQIRNVSKDVSTFLSARDPNTDHDKGISLDLG